MRNVLFTVAVLATMGQVAKVLADISGPIRHVAPIRFATVHGDAIGDRLQKSFIWTTPDDVRPGVAVAFVKSIDLPSAPRKAELHLFADSRYVLWVNGQYAGRGPNRFQPNGPEYDTLDIAAHLRPGRNRIAVLVISSVSTGKTMQCRPGLAACLDLDGAPALQTDASWRWSDHTPVQSIEASWPRLSESLVDARVPDADWVQTDGAADGWKNAVAIAGEAWGPLSASRIPPLRETPVELSFDDNVHLPVTLSAGQKVSFHAAHLVQAYVQFTLTADAGAEIAVDPYQFKYITRAGTQQYMSLDTCGTMRGSITVKKGSVTLTDLRAVERRYPFERVGSFDCSDPFLNRLWAMGARSCEVLSEDAYVDCADRERVEWMDNDPPAFEVTRVAMAGPGRVGGGRVYSDPRLLQELIRRTALTLQPEGWVKAHTASDRFDIHAKMEDRACDWVTGMRRYYDATGDQQTLREIWPAVVAQMDYFLKCRTERGLVSARDWVVWGNPLGYAVGETTTLNAFIYRALADAAVLGEAIGQSADAKRFGAAADALAAQINHVLWDETHGEYYAGYFTADEIAATQKSGRKIPMRLVEGLNPSTLHANLFALECGLVPPERHAQVVTAMQRHLPSASLKSGPVMVFYYALKQWYALDTPAADRQALATFREGWGPMVASPLDCSWEGFSGGSKAHIYGMFPTYFLSAYVLGVRRDDPVATRRLLIEPHWGDLTFAAGTVATEFGPVKVAWKQSGDEWSLDVDLPPNVTATLALPALGAASVQLDGQPIETIPATGRLRVPLSGGYHAGVMRMKPKSPATAPAP
ncbi:MAG: alpha-L-rhamnosidase-related protein [Tepidisphaeraceae bacterium]